MVARRGRAPRRRGHLSRSERVGPGAQQLPGGRVEEHECGGLDADADQLPTSRISAASSGGGGAKADQAAARDQTFDLGRLAVLGWWQRGRPGWNGPR